MDDKIIDLVKSSVSKKQWKPGDWIQYSGPVFDESEYSVAIESILKGWFAFGNKCREVEKNFPKHFGKKLGAYVNSGSSANLLMMLAFKEKYLQDKSYFMKYDQAQHYKVITSVVGFPTTINPIIQAGLWPVFVDIDIPSLNMNLDLVEKVCKEQKYIKAIMYSPVLGNPTDNDRLLEICKKYDLVLLEDACDSLGSTYKGKLLGSFGEISTCSFFPAHHITSFEGGFVATDDARIDNIVHSLRDWGRDCMCNKVSPEESCSKQPCMNRFKDWLKSGYNYDHRYVFSRIGYNLKPTEVQGAVLLEQIKKINDFDKIRKHNFERMLNIFKPYEEFFYLPEPQKDADVSWFAFLLTLKENKHFSRDQFVEYLESKFIQTRSYFAGNILKQPAYKKYKEIYNSKGANFVKANYVTKNSFMLGCYQGLTDEMIDYIKESVDEYMKDKK